jgi:hypothetical protein
VIDVCADVIIIDSIRLVTGTESRKGNKEVIEAQKIKETYPYRRLPGAQSRKNHRQEEKVERK